MKLKIKVTRDCIMNGVKGCGESCAIALAVHDIFPHAFVDEEGIYMEGLLHRYLNRVLIAKPIPVPENVKEFIRWFDDGLTIKEALPEFEFEIDIPDAVIDQINIDEIEKLLINHPTLELVKKDKNTYYIIG